MMKNWEKKVRLEKGGETGPGKRESCPAYFLLQNGQGKGQRGEAEKLEKPTRGESTGCTEGAVATANQTKVNHLRFADLEGSLLCYGCSIPNHHVLRNRATASELRKISIGGQRHSLLGTRI